MQAGQKEPYPRIKQLGLTIVTDCPNSIPGIKWEELKEKLGDKFEQFSEFYGAQTQGMNGPYVYDIESCLERLFSGKLEGTQHPFSWD